MNPPIYILCKQKCLFPKVENRKAKQVSLSVASNGSGRDVEKGCRRVNMVEKLFTHI
jgi:hypothetical protein